MKTTTICNTENFRVNSIGNGLCYEFIKKSNNHFVFFQGDDAAEFENEKGKAEKAWPNVPTDTILELVWGINDYDLIARPIEQSYSKVL